MANAGTAYVDIKGDLTSLNKSLAGFFGGSKLGSMGKKAGLAIGVGMAGGIAAAGAGKGLFELGQKFDNAFDVIRVSTGKTGDSLKGLKGDFNEVFKSVPGNMEDTAKAVGGLAARLNISGKPLQRLSQQLLQLAHITGTDVQENVESVTRLFKDWTVPTEGQANSLDKLFRVFQKTGLTVDKNARLMVAFGSPLRQLGFDFDTAAAMFGRFEKEGVNMTTLLPGFRFALKNLSAPTSEVTAQLEKLGAIGDEPREALQKVFAAIKNAPTDLKANAIAFEIFGKRAGPDMAAAVREGRLELDALKAAMNTNSDSINKAEKDTRDFAESWELLKKRMAVAIQPAALKVFEGISIATEKLATADLSKIGTDLGIDTTAMEADLSQATKRIQSILDSGLVKFIASNILGGVKRGFQGVVQTIRGQLTAIAGILKLIDDLMHLRFAKAWGDVKQIFRGGVQASIGVMRTMTAPMREIASRVGAALLRPLRAAWQSIRDTTQAGANAAIRSIRRMGGAFSAVGGTLRAVASGPFKAIKDAIKAVIEVLGKVIGFARKAANAIGDIKPPSIDINPFAKGGPVRRNQVALVGEQGPELVTLPVGSRVHANPESQRMAKRMGIKGFAKGGKVKASTGGAAKTKALDFAHEIWPLVASRLRAEGMPMPKVEFRGSDKAKSYQPGPGYISVTQGKSGLDKIVGPPWWMQNLARRMYEGLYILTHEFGHIFQLNPRNLDEQEGGVEGFAGRVAPGVANTLGVEPKPMLSPYSRQIRRLKRQRGKGYEQYVLNRQFGFDSKGRETKAKRAADKSLGGQLWYETGGPTDHKNLGRAASGLTPAARYLANTMRAKFGLSISPQGGVRPGDTGSFHSVGKAVDLVGSQMRAGAEWIKASGLYKTLEEGIHNPNLSVEAGKFVGKGHWDEEWANHKDHIHLAASRIIKAAKDKVAEKVKKPKRITGSLSLGQMVTLAKKVGFPDPALAAAVGYAESRGKVGAVGDGGDSLGLWQINTPSWPKYDKGRLQGDALYNAKAALAISRKGKKFTDWTMFNNGQYKQFLGAKGKPLPKGTSTGAASTGSKYSDYLAMRLLEAESDTPSDPKDDIRWINRAMRYWRGVRKRNRAAGNWARAGEALGELNSLKTKKKELRTDLEDENLFKLGDLDTIGKGVNAFKIGGLQTTLDNIGLEKANASLTVPADNDDSIGALKASLQDDISAATRLVGFWQGLKTLVDGFFQPSGPVQTAFNPTPEQSKQLARTKSQPERIALLNQFQAEWKARGQRSGNWIQGTIAQKIEATNELGSAKSDLRSLLAEVNKTEETETVAGSNAKAEIKSFLAAIGDLTKTFGSNFKPLQSFADGGIIQGPRGKKVVIEGHGGEAVINEDGNLTVTIDPKQLEKMVQQPTVKNIDARSYFKEVPPQPHGWSKAVLHELEAG